MKNKRKMRLAALLAVLLLLFPAFAVEDDMTDESDTSTTQTETEQTEETDQTAQLGGTDSIDPSADKPRVFDYEEVLSQTENDLLETKTKAIAEKYGVGVGIITIDDYTPYGDGAYDAAEQLYNELDLGASEDGDGVALLISLDDRSFATYAHGAKAEEIFSDAVLQDLEPYFLDNFGNDDWYGGFSDFVSGCEWYLQHVAEGGEAGVPVHNEVEIPDSTQSDSQIDTEDDSFSLGGAFGLSLIISCVIALIVCMVFRSQMKSVRTQTTANQYVANGGLKLTLSRDIYRYTSQKRRQIPQNDNNNHPTGGGHGGAGFSGSVSHTSSSGHGRSGKF